MAAHSDARGTLYESTQYRYCDVAMICVSVVRRRGPAGEPRVLFVRVTYLKDREKDGRQQGRKIFLKSLLHLHIYIYIFEYLIISNHKALIIKWLYSYSKCSQVLSKMARSRIYISYVNIYSFSVWLCVR